MLSCGERRGIIPRAHAAEHLGLLARQLQALTLRQRFVCQGLQCPIEKSLLPMLLANCFGKLGNIG